MVFFRKIVKLLNSIHPNTVDNLRRAYYKLLNLKKKLTGRFISRFVFNLMMLILLLFILSILSMVFLGSLIKLLKLLLAHLLSQGWGCSFLETLIEYLEKLLDYLSDTDNNTDNLNKSIYENENIIYVLFSKLWEGSTLDLITETCNILILLFF